MEKDITTKKRSTRKVKPKVFNDEWISGVKKKKELVKNRNEVVDKKEENVLIHSCKKCYRIFRSKNSLNKHEYDCVVSDAEELKSGISVKENDAPRFLSTPPDRQPSVVRSFDIEKEVSDTLLDIVTTVSSSTLVSLSNDIENVQEDIANLPEFRKEDLQPGHEKKLDIQLIENNDTAESVPSSNIGEIYILSTLNACETDRNIVESVIQSVDNDTKQNNVCDICQVSIPTSRGLKSHRNACLKKQRNQANSTTIQTNTVNGNEHLSQQLQESERPETNDRTPDDQVQFQPSLVWGSLSAEDITQVSNSIYEEIVYWRINLFKLPSGAVGKRYIREMTRLIHLWVDDHKPLADISLKLLMVMPAVLLQKPSRKSTTKQHTLYLNKRLDLWDRGDFNELLIECRGIQKRLRETKKPQESERTAKVFAKLMLKEKVTAALKMLEKEASLGIADVNEHTLTELKKLHPEAHLADESALISDRDMPHFDPIMFENIDEASIAKAALKTKGAAGPSGQDADGWRRILVSKNYGDAGRDLRIAIAEMTKSLCCKEVPLIPGSEKTNIEAYTACRLMMLNKLPAGIRPIGIGEVLRRIIGKAILWEIKDDIIESAGCLQVCAGQKAGCEAAAHAMSDIFKEEETDTVLFIDASNAFNSLNRKAMLHNINYLCRPLATYMKNCYGTPSRLFVMGGHELSSQEGTTQGDPLAMPSYGIGILPFLSLVNPPTTTKDLRHLAYADDLGGGSKLNLLRDWWSRIVEHGPKFGYHPKASKSWLVVKEEKLQLAEEMFKGTDINITTEGRKYLGGYVGTEEGSRKYFKELCDAWCSQLEELSKIARTEPQAAYAAFTAGFKHKMTYFLRTIPNLSELIKPIDDIINEKFIPSITEHQFISESDRRLLSLPVKLGGLGIPIFSECCIVEFKNSRKISKSLIEKITAQDQQYEVNKRREREVQNQLKVEKESRNKEILATLRTKMSKEQLRCNDVAQMKGASAWLNALPLLDEQFVLSKRKFFDSLAIRYQWRLKRIPQSCVCGKPFTMDHAMTCGRDGFIIRRHDRIRDLLAKIMNEVLLGVRIEPPLQPLTGEVLSSGSNEEHGARVDIVARDFWQIHELAFFDIKVFNPLARTYMNQSLESAFKSNENMKKRKYNNRIIQVEKGSFTPVVLSSLGGLSLESGRFLSKLIELVSLKKNLEYSVVSNYVRTKISFELVRSQISCIRGARSLKVLTMDVNDAEIIDSSLIRD